MSANSIASKVLSGVRKAPANLANYPIIVHSHLGWDWVWQRPQQFLSRFSGRHNVLFIEGPRVVDENVTPYFTLHPDERFPNLTVMRTHFPRESFSNGEWVDAERTRLLTEALCGPLKGQFEAPVQWFYDPMAVPSFVGQMGESLNVFDCMDQLSQFKYAPPALVSREKQLLKAADVVFAGGRKMWEDKRRSNANAHFYGCGVDVEHFAKARQAATPLPADIAELPGPIFGYFGVVDERLNYELIAQLADENPNGSIVMVGPMCKVEEKDLPKRPNIHWLGGRDYQELPAYTKAFDVCLMPFALNEATEFINPTKALEYMATGTPIVSSPVPDVVSNFGAVVKISASDDEFVALCHQSATQPDQAAIERGLKMAQENTWDAIVAKLDGHVQDALCARAEKARAVTNITKLPSKVLLGSEQVSGVAV